MLLATGTGSDIALVEGLKNELQAVKTRCDMLEKTVNDLQILTQTHERTLETFRQHIIDIQAHQRTLNTSYGGEVFEVVP
jgi:chromosome segregation ATPase